MLFTAILNSCSNGIIDEKLMNDSEKVQELDEVEATELEKYNTILNGICYSDEGIITGTMYYFDDNNVADGGALTRSGIIDGDEEGIRVEIRLAIPPDFYPQKTDDEKSVLLAKMISFYAGPYGIIKGAIKDGKGGVFYNPNRTYWGFPFTMVHTDLKYNSPMYRTAFQLLRAFKKKSEKACVTVILGGHIVKSEKEFSDRFGEITKSKQHI